MATTQAEIDFLRRMRNQGVLTSEHNGRRVTFRSLTELNQLIAQCEQELAAGNGRQVIRQFLPIATKGL